MDDPADNAAQLATCRAADEKWLSDSRTPPRYRQLAADPAAEMPGVGSYPYRRDENSIGGQAAAAAPRSGANAYRIEQDLPAVMLDG
jgi:hypothetical protein